MIQSIPMRQPSRPIYTFFLAILCQIRLDASSVFTGYDIGCKHGLQLKNSLKFHFDKQISRNKLKKNS